MTVIFRWARTVPHPPISFGTRGISADLSQSVITDLECELEWLTSGASTRPVCPPRGSPRHVLKLATTNRLAAIDPAIRRPGRFDAHIVNGNRKLHTSGRELSGGGDVLPLMPTGRVGLDAGRSAPGVQPDTPGGRNW